MLSRIYFLFGFCFIGHFLTAQELQLEILQSHDEGLTALTLPPNSALVLSGGKDGRIYGWNKENGKKQLTFAQENGAVEVLTEYEDRLISAGREENIYIWNLTAESLEAILKGHKYYVESLSISKNSGLLGSGSRDNSIKLWDMKEGVQKSYLNGHSDNILAVAVHPEGRVVVSSGEDQCLKIWDLSTKEVLKEKLGEANITQLAFSPDGNYLAGVLDKKILIWEVPSWKLKFQLRGHTSSIEDMQFRPGSSTLASIDTGGKVIFWDIPEGKLIRSFMPGKSMMVALAFSNDGGQLALGYQNGRIQLWDIATLY